MEVTETVNDGLKRELKITVPKADMDAKLTERLTQMKSQVRINGFRQGKVPLPHLKKVYGRQAMAEIVNEYISTQTGDILKERKERAAQQPEVKMTEDESDAENILAGKKDFEFTLSYEVMPEINAPELAKIKIDRPVVDVSSADIEEQVERIAESARQYEEKKGKAADKDRITMNYSGKIDGEAFDGGTDDDAQLIIGSGRFIPGFEEQQIGRASCRERV